MPAPRQDLSGYRRISPPVEIVTTARGREVFADAADIFDRLAVLAGSPVEIQQVNQGQFAMSPAAIGALNAILRQPGGLRLFHRAAAAAGVPYSGKNTRWRWAYFCRYLDADWRLAA